MGLFQQLRAVFLDPDELVNGVEGKGAHAGDAVKLFLGDVLADVFHDLRRAGALPGNDGVKLAAGGVHQRAVHAEGGDGYRPHLFRIQALKGLHGAFGELLENPVRVPDVEFRVFLTGQRGVRLRGLPRDDALFIHNHRARVRRAAVQAEGVHREILNIED